MCFIATAWPCLAILYGSSKQTVYFLPRFPDFFQGTREQKEPTGHRRRPPPSPPTWPCRANVTPSWRQTGPAWWPTTVRVPASPATETEANSRSSEEREKTKRRQERHLHLPLSGAAKTNQNSPPQARAPRDNTSVTHGTRASVA